MLVSFSHTTTILLSVFGFSVRMIRVSSFSSRNSKHGKVWLYPGLKNLEQVNYRQNLTPTTSVSRKRNYFFTKPRHVSFSSLTSTNTLSAEGLKRNPGKVDTISICDPSTYVLPLTDSRDSIQTSLPEGQRIVSFGDVHGDIDALRKFLVAARIMDPNSSNDEPLWSGGTTIAIQCGDILDRGDNELKCYAVLASLSRQANNAGGAIHLLYGNHETMNTVGLFHYANDAGNNEIDCSLGKMMDEKLNSRRWRMQFAGNQPARWATFEPGGLLSEQMMARMKVAIVIGKTVFVHAGLTKSHLRSYTDGIDGMNLEASNWIAPATLHHGSNNNSGEFRNTDEIILSAQNRVKAARRTMPNCLGEGKDAPSPVWMRDYSSPPDSVPKNAMAQIMIDECLEEIGHGVKRMVMGHTPQTRINAALKGKAWRIDVGASSGVMSGTPEVLEIIHGGDNEEDSMNILTYDGTKIPSLQRQVQEYLPF